MKKIVLCANPGKDRELALTREVYRRLSDIGQRPAVCLFGTGVEENDIPPELEGGSLQELMREARFVVTFGGDGTLLHAARAAAPYEVPVLGVNLGRIGFLTELSAEDASEMILQAAQGKYTLENRMMLHAELWRDGSVLYRDYALNDAVVGGMARIVGVRIRGDGRKIMEYAGDGVVLATPTGSTAYSLSAGGPIVEPEAENLIITPISAHVLAARSYVLAPDRNVEVEILRMGDKAAYLACDGGECILLETGDVIRVSRSELRTRLMRLNDRMFYEKISHRLGESG